MFAIFLALCAMLAALSLWTRAEMAGFLSRHAAMDSSTAFEEFKAVVRRNMYGALVYIVLGLACLLLGIRLAISSGLPGLAVVLASNVTLLLLGQATKKLETAVRSLPCSHPGLAEEYRRVSETWVRKPLPNF